MKNKEYFDEKESNDFIKLTEFNNQVLHLEDFGATPYTHWTDASGYTATCRYFNIEVKDRNQDLFINEQGEYFVKGTSQFGKEYYADNLYIEQHKVSSMMMDYICCGYEPIYINFLNDGVVVVYNLSRLNKRPATENKKIKSKGYNKMEIGTREGLFLSDATIFKKDENNIYRIIQKPQ